MQIVHCSLSTNSDSLRNDDTSEWCKAYIAEALLLGGSESISTFIQIWHTNFWCFLATMISILSMSWCPDLHWGNATPSTSWRMMIKWYSPCEHTRSLWITFARTCSVGLLLWHTHIAAAFRATERVFSHKFHSNDSSEYLILNTPNTTFIVLSLLSLHLRFPIQRSRSVDFSSTFNFPTECRVRKIHINFNGTEKGRRRWILLLCENSANDLCIALETGE